MSLHCGRKLEYLQKNPENPHRQREHPTPHRKAAGLDSTQNLFHQTLNRNRQIISKSSWKMPRTTTFSFKNSLFLYTISESHKLNPSVTREHLELWKTGYWARSKRDSGTAVGTTPLGSGCCSCKRYEAACSAFLLHLHMSSTGEGEERRSIGATDDVLL